MRVFDTKQSNCPLPDVVPANKIFENIIMDEFSTSDEASPSYDMMKDMIYGLDDQVLDDYSNDFVNENWRR